MPRLFPTDWKTQLKIFEPYGCRYKRKEGSHHVLSCAGAKRAVVIPEYDEIDVDIIKNNMRTVNMSRMQAGQSVAYPEILRLSEIIVGHVSLCPTTECPHQTSP